MEKEPRVEVPAFPTRQKAWAKTVQMENLTAIWTGPPRVSDYSKIPPRVADFFSTAHYKQIPRQKNKNMDIDGFSTDRFFGRNYTPCYVGRVPYRVPILHYLSLVITW